MRKEKKIQKLLEVLDLEKNEQVKFLHLRGKLNKGECREALEDKDLCCKHLADLVFRIRDEFQSVLQKVDFEIGRFHVFSKCNDKSYIWTEEHCEMVDSWFVDWAEPIHWIIAALIAKELELNNK